MADPTDPTDVSVSERGSRYSGSTHGPPTDAAVHVRETPMVGDRQYEYDRPSRTPAPADHVPDLRKSLRSADEVAKHRVRQLPEWLPGAAAGALFLGVLAVGGWYVVTWVTADVSAPPPKAAPVADEIQGVPVRRGLQGPGELPAKQP